MKSFFHWSKTVGLIGGAIASAIFAGSLDALALTDAEIVEALGPVPVFTITDEAGAPLIAAPPDGEDGESITGVFISLQDAESFLNGLRENNPELAGAVQVVPVSLGEVYELAVATEDQGLQFVFMPMQQQVESAVAILQEAGQDVEGFEGVPLFLARSDEGEGGYLTMQQDEEEIIPVFFKKEELQSFLDRLQESQPDLASNLAIQVISLEGLLNTFQSSDNPELNQIRLIPPEETMDYIDQLQSGQEEEAPQ